MSDAIDKHLDKAFASLDDVPIRELQATADAIDRRTRSIGGARCTTSPASSKTSPTHGKGLCQIYGNEPWHYELRPDAIDHACPAMYADPTHDPRMQQ
jgi:hypothetical protein